VSEIIEHEGVVRSVSGGKAVVAVRTGGCGGCGHQSGCGLGRLAGKGRDTEMTVAVDGNIRPGDLVVLALEPGRMVKAALMAYLLPAFTLMLGAAAGAGLGGSDGTTALGAVAGLMAGLLVTRLLPNLALVPKASLLRQAPEGKPSFLLHVINSPNRSP
jgi:sigma-E factor negative regulatory protein RseC